jgi:putative transposase
VSRFTFVAAERANHAVATLCRIIGASVSGFYAWLRAIPAVQDRAKAEAGVVHASAGFDGIWPSCRG